MNNFSETANFLWSIADLIRDVFKRGKYQDVILPFTVLRRIDSVLAPTKAAVLEADTKLRGKLENLDPQLRRASGYAFYNTSPYDFDRLLDDAPNLAANLRSYINSFSDNMREVLEKFDFHNTIQKLDDAGLLFLVMERFSEADLHPERITNLQMGYIFEELIRRFNEALNENPGEHFTPREVITLMVDLLLAQDADALAENHIVRTVYDPCCGSGGMLTIAQDRIREINPQAEVHLFGQEVNPETYAMCKADLYIKSADGRDAEHIAYGSTLGNDRHSDRRFDYLITNPPYGKDWKMDQRAVENEARRGDLGRFGAGTPRISDGQLLFLQHMLNRMNAPCEGGSRVAIVMNGSPLFTGDAGSGESEIRRWMLENDWLEAIIALPEQLFYNTGIATYVWILSNRKPAERKHKVMLIDATAFWQPMRKSLGDKRREISRTDRAHVVDLYTGRANGDHAKVFQTTDFGYRKIRVERPLRLRYETTEGRIARLWDEPTFANLAISRKKDSVQKAEEEQWGRATQSEIVEVLYLIGERTFMDRRDFDATLDAETQRAEVKLSAPVRKAIHAVLSERDENAAICVDSKGQPEPDPDLRDFENVPLREDINDYFAREVLPHVPDAWIDPTYTDDRDGQIGKVGYEINFNRYFYVYEPPRPLDEIEADIRALEQDIIRMLREVTE